MNNMEVFGEFIARHKPKVISFLSQNQDQFDVSNPCLLQLSFTHILISKNPSVIYLTEGVNSLRLDRVKYAEFSEKITPIGSLIKIYCCDPNKCNGEAVYTIIAK